MVHYCVCTLYRVCMFVLVFNVFCQINHSSLPFTPPHATIPPSTLPSLLSRNCSVLQAVGERIPFEITVGRNGRVWVKTDNPHHTILIANAIRASERLSPLRTRDMVKEMLKTVNV
eukprot:m.114168 g.114168  ORF g.114168 m.114168 type:complete len:116 (-) comp9274_c2_seq5:1471-1818(-)